MALRPTCCVLRAATKRLSTSEMARTKQHLLSVWTIDVMVQVVNSILGASLMMLGGALAFRYRLDDRESRDQTFILCMSKCLRGQLLRSQYNPGIHTVGSQITCMSTCSARSVISLLPRLSQKQGLRGLSAVMLDAAFVRQVTETRTATLHVQRLRIPASATATAQAAPPRRRWTA